MKRSLCVFSALIIAGLVAACGGSSGGQTAGIDGSGAPVATSAYGTIDGFGSVLVNGVKYETSKAAISINGETATEDDLRAGYLVRVTATSNQDQATAERVEFVPSLIGPIEAIDLGNKRLTILGQGVDITSNTLFGTGIRPRSLAGLSIDQRVLISGAQAADGTIRAGRVELVIGKLPQLSGRVANLTGSHFTLNTLSVNYTGARLVNIASSELINGASVSVIGALLNNQLHATVIIGLERKLDITLSQVDREGFVTRFNSATDFDLAGVSVSTNSQTNYSNGSASDLALGAKIEVVGSVNGAGKLLARSLVFEPRITNKVSGKVSALELSQRTGIVSGALELDGIRIITTAQTRYEDKKLSLKRFNLAFIELLDTIEVTGYSTSGGFIATKIERQENDDDDNAEREYQGAISATGADYIVLFGRQIFTTPATEIKDAQGQNLSLEAFYALALHQQVEVQVYMDKGTIYAASIELEDEDD